MAAPSSRRNAPRATATRDTPPTSSWETLLAAQKALADAERACSGPTRWLSERQAEYVLDRGIDETMEDMLADLEHAVPSREPGPDLQTIARLLFAELRGRMTDKLSLGGTDLRLRGRRGA